MARTPYPNSQALRTALTEAGFDDHPVAQAAVEYVGAYEHGDANLTDLDRNISYRQLNRVLVDFVLYVANKGE